MIEEELKEKIPWQRASDDELKEHVLSHNLNIL